MTVVMPSLPSPTLANAPRQEVSFNQRHAWMRQYEHAEHGARTDTGAQDRAADARAPEVVTAAGGASHAAGPLPAQPAAAARPAAAPHGAHAAGSSAAAARADAPAPQDSFTPTAAWLRPQAERAASAGLSLGAAVAPRPRAPGRDISEREITVARTDDSLSVTVRDATLDDTHAREILRRLNLSGAAFGVAHVVVTVNGHAIEQRPSTAHNPPEHPWPPAR